MEKYPQFIHQILRSQEIVPRSPSRQRTPTPMQPFGSQGVKAELEYKNSPQVYQSKLGNKDLVLHSKLRK